MIDIAGAEAQSVAATGSFWQNARDALVWGLPFAELLLGLFVAWVAFVFYRARVEIAAEQTAIAAAQRDIANNQLKFDLLEQRLKIFETVNDFAHTAIREAACDIDDVAEFRHQTANAEFLFDRTIAALIEEMIKNAVDIVGANDEMKSRLSAKPLAQDTRTPAERVKDARVYFFNLIKPGNSSGILHSFRPFLSFDIAKD